MSSTTDSSVSSSSNIAPLDEKLSSKLSHTLTKILRHAAPSLGLELDSRGYAKLDELLALPMIQRIPGVNLQAIQSVVHHCPKQRFGLLTPSKEEGGMWKIRANQGHNEALAAIVDANELMTQLTHNSSKPLPQHCIHGTNLTAWNIILKSGGLSPMQRTHIHFASHDYGSADMISGMRRDSDILIHLDLAKVLAWQASHPQQLQLTFYQSANSVILTDGVREYSRILPSFLFSHVEQIIRSGSSFQRHPLEWQRPTEQEWMTTFAQRYATRSVAEITKSPSSASSSSAITKSSSSTATSQPQKFAPRPSRWGPPATSRPPHDWKVPPELEHIVNGTASTDEIKAREMKLSNAAIQPFQYLCILDFEATCDDHDSGRKRFEPQEIIEFPIILFNTSTGEIEDTFHKYVQPIHQPILTPFCTELTGITQEMVSPQKGAITFEQVWKEVHQWLEKHHLIPPTSSSSASAAQTPLKSFAFVTCGDWDLKTMLPQQFYLTFQSRNIPAHFQQWINIKTSFNDFYHSGKNVGRGMPDLLQKLGLKLEGRHHSGIDDCKNITAIAHRMVQDGCIFRLTKQDKKRPFQPSSATSPTATPSTMNTSHHSTPLSAALNRNGGQSRIQ